MPELLSTAKSPQPAVFSTPHVVYADPREGWLVVTLNQGAQESVAIGHSKTSRLRRDLSSQQNDWFILPPELAEPVLKSARSLEAKRQSVLRKGYADQAADLQSEAEALEWCEAMIGDGLATDPEAR